MQIERESVEPSDRISQLRRRVSIRPERHHSTSRRSIQPDELSDSVMALESLMESKMGMVMKMEMMLAKKSELERWWELH